MLVGLPVWDSGPGGGRVGAAGNGTTPGPFPAAGVPMAREVKTEMAVGAEQQEEEGEEERESTDEEQLHRRRRHSHRQEEGQHEHPEILENHRHQHQHQHHDDIRRATIMTGRRLMDLGLSGV